MKVIDSYRMEYTEDPVPPVKERPVCPQCKKPRKIYRDYFDKNRWRYAGYGYFCTLRCAEQYANLEVIYKLMKSTLKQ